jgi:hypothetical protein
MFLVRNLPGALTPTPVTLEALQSDVGPPAGVPPAFTSMFPPPDAKMIHVYATALSTAASVRRP